MLRKASAVWKGSIKEGKGSVKTETGLLDAPYSFTSRFESGKGTNPEELIGAAHAGCFSMALSLMLGEAGFEPQEISTTAEVKIEKDGDGFTITGIKLLTEAVVPGIDRDTFVKHAEEAKAGCPVSRALQGTEISLEAKLQ